MWALSKRLWCWFRLRNNCLCFIRWPFSLLVLLFVSFFLYFLVSFFLPRLSSSSTDAHLLRPCSSLVTGGDYCAHCGHEPTFWRQQQRPFFRDYRDLRQGRRRYKNSTEKQQCCYLLELYLPMQVVLGILAVAPSVLCVCFSLSLSFNHLITVLFLCADDKYRKKTHAPEYRGPPDAADSVYWEKDSHRTK